MSCLTYQGFTYEDLAKDYSYDPIKGEIKSNRSGLPLSSQSGVMNKRTGGRGSVRLQMNILAIILYQGEIVDGQEVKLLDRDKSNLRFSNLCIVKPGEVTSKFYCKPTVKEGVVENLYRGCFVVRGNKQDAVYYTKTLEEALLVRDRFELTGLLAKHLEAPHFPDWLERKPVLW